MRIRFVAKRRNPGAGTMKQISVLIADDHAMVREAIACIVGRQNDMCVIGQAGDGRECVEKAARLDPDVIAIDISMPHLNGLDAVWQIRRRAPATRVLVLTAHEEDLYIEHALEAGVDGFVSKSAPTSELAEAIRKVSTGKKAFSPAVMRRLPQYEKNLKDRVLRRKKSECLTAREIEILQLIGEGNANKQTADNLGISIKTVEKHRQHLMDKLKIHDTASLTRYAISAGLIEAPRDFVLRPAAPKEKKPRKKR